MTPLRNRWLIGTLVAVLVVATVVLAARNAQPEPVRTDPNSAAPIGSRAVTRVLTERGGINVVTVTTPAELRAAGPDSATTVVVSHNDRLALSRLRETAAELARAGRVVLVDPDSTTLDGLGIPAERVDFSTEDVTGGCDSQDVSRDWQVAGPVSLFSPRPGAFDPGTTPTQCLVREGNHGSAYLLLPRMEAGFAGVSGADSTPPAGRPETVLLGTDAMVVNRTVTDKDHAAIALRTLGHHRRLIWYLPTPEPGQNADGPTLAPAWFGPALLAIAGAVLGLCLWRGRRLGPLVVESLPAVVKATETTEVRARLYQRANEPHRALNVLRSATVDRLRRQLKLSPTSSVEDVARATAVASGRTDSAVIDLLRDSSAVSRTGRQHLARTATALRQLEKEVHPS